MTPDTGNRVGGFRPPLHLRTPKKTDMPRQYRVIDVVPTPPMTESSSVTAHDIEAALNVHAKEGWELLTVIDKQHLPIRGNVVVDEGHGATLPLKPSHPPAQPRLVCLARLLEQFGPTGILCKRSVTIFM
jgi:hypothetical protein